MTLAQSCILQELLQAIRAKIGKAAKQGIDLLELSLLGNSSSNSKTARSGVCRGLDRTAAVGLC
ncbi:hypothetical protein [Bradyrhizobium sp. NBAIM01]|uniref:hypothetical protein n=1 Tax=Bradyrhizobium sp. NBAIM01 TaxID=2793818 RepID=UPI001CD373E9|nr:hypothetical protein [Bradyrhizobium sp. NBAIM01]MCA1516229.1 hypothetical protein [Bradyrhizobium sp. NBAIM01]